MVKRALVALRQKGFRSLHIWALLGALLLGVGCSQAAGGIATAKGAGLAQTSLNQQWLLVNYWAQWCKPCIKEIPELNKLHHELDDVTVIGVNYDGATGEKLLSQIQKLKIDFPVILQDPMTLWQFETPLVLPTTLVIAPGGEVVRVLKGPQEYTTLVQVLDEAKRGIR